MLSVAPLKSVGRLAFINQIIIKSLSFLAHQYKAAGIEIIIIIIIIIIIVIIIIIIIIYDRNIVQYCCGTLL